MAGKEHVVKLKLVTIEGKTYAEVQDGKPVYATDDGKDIAFDAVGTADTIKRLNAEAKGHREGKEAAEAKLKAFEGIDDAEAARKALETVRNLDDKKLVDAGKVEEIKAAAIKAIEDKYAPVVEERDRLKGDLYAERVGGKFARSKFIAEKLTQPSDIIEARFGKHFKDEEGKTVAYDASGNKVYSRAKPGETADFDEALEILIDQYPYKDSLLKGTGGGSGAKPGNGGGGGPKTIARSEFDKLGPAEQMQKVTSDGFTVVDG